MLDACNQRGAFLLRGGQARRLADPVARQNLRRWNPQQPALLQRREFPGVGDGEEALQGVAPRVPRRPATGRLQHQSRSGTGFDGNGSTHLTLKHTP